MPVVISDSIVVSSIEEFDADNPLVGWDNLVTTSNVTATRSDTGAVAENTEYPATNLANTSTYLRFQQLTAGQSINLNVTLNGLEPVDYLAVAGHNFGTAGRSIKVQGATGFDGSGNPVYYDLTQEVILGENTPLLFRFTEAPYVAIRLALVSLNTTGVVYATTLFVGKLLVLERKIQVAFTPLPLGRRADVVNSRSERGQFLGRLVIGEWTESAATITHMTPDWYRENMDPFVEAAITEPFFFAWAPVSYPLEVGYAWLKEVAVPEIMNPIGILSITLDMQGIVE